MDPGWFLTAAPEHVIWTYIYLRDFDQWMALIGGQLDDHVPPHKSSFVMRVVMEEFSEAKCTAILVASNGLQTCQEVIEAIKTLPAVVGTDATSRGHTMTLLGVLSSGVVVNDPNGACRMKSQYLENGSSGLAPPEHRWSMNASLAGADPKTEERTDWGETNFFTWDEVETLQIGKWSVSVDSEGASEAQQAIT